MPQCIIKQQPHHLKQLQFPHKVPRVKKSVYTFSWPCYCTTYSYFPKISFNVIGCISHQDFYLQGIDLYMYKIDLYVFLERLAILYRNPLTAFIIDAFWHDSMDRQRSWRWHPCSKADWPLSPTCYWASHHVWYGALPPNWC